MSSRQKGFITIATGSTQYYKLAANLLRSYRFNCSDPYPFALITDRENTYTAEFDDIVLINDSSFSFMDKLRIFDLSPYDETIFIDSDSLAFADLNPWFSLFEEYGDFSLFGYAHEDLNTSYGWFNYSGMKEYRKDITFIPIFNGGVYYMRNTPACKRVFEIAKNCADNYSDYSFNKFKEPADEPVLALGMAVCGFKPLDGERVYDEFLYDPDEKKLSIDSVSSEVSYDRDGRIVSPSLIHWGSYKTKKALYRFETEKLEKYCDSSREKTLSYKMLYDHKLRYYMLLPFDTLVIGRRAYRNAKRIIKERLKKVCKSV